MRLPDLNRRVAVVTGASGGIGTAVCDGLLAQGSRVFGLDVDAGQLGVREGFRLIRCDLTQPAAIEAAFEEISSLTDQLDYVVNIAGSDPKYSLSEGTPERWQSAKPYPFF
jgi:3-oxoacyl-[acyl-carrier protein] reductase